MISIICPSNNEKILNNNLLKTLNQQTFKDYEIIIVDTINNKYRGASEALNSGAQKAKGEYFLFCHHDINFINKDSLENIVNCIEKINDFGIIGVAGINSRNCLLGNILNGPNKELIGEKINKPMKVFSLDEVFFIIKKDFYFKYPLNLNNNTWHLYAVEYCLKMHELGENVIIIPSEIYHKSDGVSLNESYYIYLRKLRKEYKKYKEIYTTVGSWYTNKILFELQMLKRKIMR